MSRGAGLPHKGRGQEDQKKILHTQTYPKSFQKLIYPLFAPLTTAPGSRCCWPADSPYKNRQCICYRAAASTNVVFFYSAERLSPLPQKLSGIPQRVPVCQGSFTPARLLPSMRYQSM